MPDVGREVLQQRPAPVAGAFELATIYVCVDTCSRVETLLHEDELKPELPRGVERSRWSRVHAALARAHVEFFCASVTEAEDSFVSARREASAFIRAIS